MATITEKRDIKGTTYHIEQLGALKGRKVLLRLSRIAAPMLGAISEADKPSVKTAFDAWAQTANEEDFEFLCDVFAETTTFEQVLTSGATIKTRLSESGVFDRHFAGRYSALLGWLWACLDINFSSFLAEARADFGNLWSEISAKVSD